MYARIDRHTDTDLNTHTNLNTHTHTQVSDKINF